MIKFQDLANLVHAIVGDSIVLPRLTTANRNALTNVQEGTLVNHDGVLEQWKDGAWTPLTDGYVTIDGVQDIDGVKNFLHNALRIRPDGGLTNNLRIVNTEVAGEYAIQFTTVMGVNFNRDFFLTKGLDNGYRLVTNNTGFRDYTFPNRSIEIVGKDELDAIPIIHPDQFGLDSLGQLIIEQTFLPRTGPVNFNYPGFFGEFAAPLETIPNVSLNVGHQENTIIIYISTPTVPDFVTDLGANLTGDVYSVDPSKLNRIELRMFSQETTKGTNTVHNREGVLGNFIYMNFEEYFYPVPATVVDNGTPGLPIHLDTVDYSVDAQLGPVGVAFELGHPTSNAGSFILLDRTDVDMAAFLDGMLSGFSMMFWAMCPTSSDVNVRTIFDSNRDGAGNYTSTGVVLATFTNGQITFGVAQASGAAGPQRIATGASTLLTNTGVWMHIAATWRKSTNTAYIWVDKIIEASSTSLVASTAVSANDAHINKSPVGHSRQVIFDDMIIKPVYITQQEVNDHYAKADLTRLNAAKKVTGSHLHLDFKDSIDPLPLYLTDMGTECLRAIYEHEGGGTAVETDGVKQALAIGLENSSGGSRVRLNMADPKIKAFFDSLSESFTIAFRVKVNPDSTTASRVIFSTVTDSNYTNGTGIELRCLSDGRLQAFIGAMTADPSANRVISDVGVGITNDGVYGDWVVTYVRSTSTGRIYKNGVQVGLNSSLVVDNISNFVSGVADGLLSNGHQGNRYQTVYSLFLIMPGEATPAQRTEIFQ